MPPGYLQSAGGYYMIESGSCGGGLISTKSGCDAAATALDLSYDGSWLGATEAGASALLPPGCSLYVSSSLASAVKARP